MLGAVALLKSVCVVATLPNGVSIAHSRTLFRGAFFVRLEFVCITTNSISRTTARILTT